MPRKPSSRAREVMGYVAANVRRARTKKGLTQADLAEAANVDETYVARVERGAVNLSVGILAQLSDALGVKPGELLKAAKMHEIEMGRPKLKS